MQHYASFQLGFLEGSWGVKTVCLSVTPSPPKNIVFFCLKIFFTLINSVDPDEMPHYAVFGLGLHCL